MMSSRILWIISCRLHQSGADAGFSNRGAAKDYVHAAHISSSKREVPYDRGPGPLSGPPEALGF